MICQRVGVEAASLAQEDMGPVLGLFLSCRAERWLERVLAEWQQQGGQLQEQLTQQLSQTLSAAVAGRLERSIRDEIKKTVPPCEWFLGFEFVWFSVCFFRLGVTS